MVTLLSDKKEANLMASFLSDNNEFNTRKCTFFYQLLITKTYKPNYQKR